MDARSELESAKTQKIGGSAPKKPMGVEPRFLLHLMVHATPGFISELWKHTETFREKVAAGRGQGAETPSSEEPTE